MCSESREKAVFIKLQRQQPGCLNRNSSSQTEVKPPLNGILSSGCWFTAGLQGATQNLPEELSFVGRDCGDRFCLQVSSGCQLVIQSIQRWHLLGLCLQRAFGFTPCTALRTQHVLLVVYPLFARVGIKCMRWTCLDSGVY